MRIHHLAIQVGDLVAAEAFYAGVLGLVVSRRQSHAVWVDVGGAILMLEHCAGPTPATPWASDTPGLFVLALAIAPADRDEWRGRLARAGVSIDHETGFTSYFRDPWGTRLALSHYPD